MLGRLATSFRSARGDRQIVSKLAEDERAPPWDGGDDRESEPYHDEDGQDHQENLGVAASVQGLLEVEGTPCDGNG